MKSQKYYVVWKGRKTGIFTTWKECEKQIYKFRGAEYKSFKTRKEAQEAFESEKQFSLSNVKQNKDSQNIDINQPIIEDSICVDASCLGNPGLMEYQGVQTQTKELLFREGPMNNGTNNIGEFLAIVHGLVYLKNKGDNQTAIYSDSKTAMLWVKNKRVKTTLKQTSNNQEVFHNLDKALNWLNNNDYSNPILKWDTSSLGEIPADFGRKSMKIFLFLYCEMS